MKHATSAHARLKVSGAGSTKQTKEVMTSPSGKTLTFQRKRVNFELPELVADQLSEYAEQTGRSKTEFVRTAIGVFAILCDEIAVGNRVFVMQRDGKVALRELVLPP